jgi:hypothetical protein
MSNILVPNFLYQEIFQHHNFCGTFRIVGVLYFKNHTYNYWVNGQRALILPKLKHEQSFWDGGNMNKSKSFNMQEIYEKYYGCGQMQLEHPNVKV